MADRYWVGGTDNWDGSAGTKWALTSGGAGGQAVPTSADDVYFDAASGAGTITVNLSARPCRNLTFTGFTGTFASSGTGSITCSGNLTFSSGMTITYTTGITLNGTGSQTLTFNGRTFTGNLGITAGAGTYTAQDIVRVSGTLTLTSGTLNSGIYDLYAGILSSSNTNTRALIVGGILYLTGASTLIAASTTTGLTWNAPTLYITDTSATGKILTYSTIAYSSTIYVTGNGTGTYSFNLSTNTVPDIFLQNTGGASVSFNTSTVRSIDFTGATMTLNSGNTVTLTKDLIFSSGVTVVQSPNFVLTGAATGTAIISLAGKVLTSNFTVNGAGNTFNFTTVFGGASLITQTAGIVNINANVTLSGAYTFTAGSLTINNSASLLFTAFSAASTSTRSLTLGTSTLTLTGTGTVWNINSTNLTFSGASSTIILSNTAAPATGATFAGAGLTYGTVIYARVGATATFTITGSSTFTNFVDKDNAAAHTISFPSAGTQTFGHFDVRGSAGAVVSLARSAAASVSFVKSPLGVVNCDYISISISAITATPTTFTWYAGANSTVASGNTGWIAAAIPARKLGAAGAG